MTVMMINPGLAVILNNSWNRTRMGAAAPFILSHM